MSKGHVKLGALGTTLREYIIDPTRYRKSQANPWTTKLNTGGDKYDDLEPFSFHVEQDWQAGVGKKMEDDGGFTFASAETRVPNQIILPQEIKREATTSYDGLSIAIGSLNANSAQEIMTIAPAGTIRKVAIKLDTSGSTAGISSFGLYGRVDSLGSKSNLVSEIREDSPTGAVVDTGTFVYGEFESPAYRWMHIAFDSLPLLNTTKDYYLVVYVTTGTLELVCMSAYTGVDTKTYNGTTWADAAGAFVHPLFDSNRYEVFIDMAVRFNNTLYGGSILSQKVSKLVSGVWTYLTDLTIANFAISMTVFGNKLYIGTNNNYHTVTTADVVADSGVNGKFMYAWNNYLYRITFTNTLLYSADGSSWTACTPVIDTAETINGIVGIGDTVYITTNIGMYYLAPGNVVKRLCRFGSNRPLNGLSPVNFQGTCYVIADGGVAQISIAGGAATVTPAWIARNEDLTTAHSYNPYALCVANNWLFVVNRYDPASSSVTSIQTKPTVWAWNGQGWHYIMEMPLARDTYAPRGLHYDFTTSSLRVFSSNVFKVRVADYTTNPLVDVGSRYAPSGWMETPWINGGLIDVEKDFESVYIKGSELATEQTVTVFWQERGGAWQELGIIDSDGEELRWSDETTRPACKEIKLGFRLFTKSHGSTPNIEAIRLKFRHNVEDRWAWTLIMPIHNNQQMVDGDTNPYTLAQVKQHLEDLVRSTPPFEFEDVDGTEYVAVCTGYELNLSQYQYYDAANQTMYTAAVSLEQYITQA